MKPNRLLYLSQDDVISAGLTMAEIIEALEVAFREKGRGNTEMPPKPGIHPGVEDNFIHAMPAYIPALNAAGVKWVSGFPGNHKKGLPYITGLLILNDPETGIPISVMDAVPRHPDEEPPVVTVIGRPPVLRVGHQRYQWIN